MKVQLSLAVCLSLYITSHAFAELPYSATFKWQPPTAFTDSAKTPLDPEKDLKEFRLYCDTVLVDAPQVISVSPPYEWTAPYGIFKPGEHTCHMTAVTTKEHSSMESAPSKSTTFPIDPLTPGPVIIFEVM